MNTPLHPDDISRFITGRLTNSLAAGQIPWRGTVPGLPEHALTGEPFTGVNVLLLWQAMQQRSLHSGRWLTGDDLRQLGGQVRGGEKPVTLVRYRPSLSLFKVINLEQCDGLPDTLQPLWPLPPRPGTLPEHNQVRELLLASGVPLVHRDGILPVYRALHDRIELPSQATYASEAAYGHDLMNLLVQATGHPQRLHRFGLTVDTRTDELQEALVAELGTAFLSAGLGLPGVTASCHDVAPWVSFLHDDPWRLFRAADAARKAMVWLTERRPAMTTVEMWQKMATLILETHYGFPLDDTTLYCRSVVERHLECGITPLMAINALARIYQWERCDQPQRSLFLNETGAESEILTLSEIRPELLTYYRVPATSGVPEVDVNAGTAGSLPLLPAPEVSEGEGAANDDGPDDPDDNVVALPWAARRGKTNPHVQRFVSLFNQTAPNENRWQVFSDFVHMAACSLYNAMHKDEDFEADYMRRVGRYSREDANNMSRLLAEVIEGLEFCPTDFLGQIFMNLELGNARHGQFFTPYHVSHMMAQVTLGDGLSVLTSGERDFITVSDPACGAGGMIVAMAEAMLEAGFNPQKQMMVYCVDIDPVAAMMCYIQLSLMGIPAIVAIGNSLTVEIKREMATPMFVLGHWHHRWQAERTRKAA